MAWGNSEEFRIFPTGIMCTPHTLTSFFSSPPPPPPMTNSSFSNTPPPPQHRPHRNEKNIPVLVTDQHRENRRIIYNQMSPTCSSSASSGMKAMVHVSSKIVASKSLITMPWSSSSLVVSFSSASLSSPSEITSPPWACPSVRSHFSQK